MLILLPLIALLLAALALHGRQVVAAGSPDLRLSILKAATLWGAALVLVSEGLGLVSLLNQPSLALAWTAIALAVGLIAWRSGWLVPALADARRQVAALPRHGKAPLVFTLAIVAALGAIALISPPNNNDSLNYHMARVAHWAQNGSLSHYATAFQPQLWSPIWAETAILHTYLLAGGDALANAVQLGAMLGSLIVASLIAARLGARPAGQWLAAAAVLSLPMGILQATSTQNDYAAGFWLLCLAYWAVQGMTGGIAGEQFVYLGLALGLGAATKGTTYIYAIPAVALLAGTILRRHGLWRGLRYGLLVGAVAALPNFGFWFRNLQTYRQPLGPSEWLNDRAAGSGSLSEMAVNTVRYASLNWGTPWNALNDRMQRAVIGFCELLSVEQCEAFGPDGIHQYRIPLLSNHEDSAGNPAHFALWGVALIGVAASKRLRRHQLLVAYLGLASVTYLVFTWLVTWEIFGSRYQLPLFLLAAPGVAVALSALVGPRPARWLAVGLMLAGLPWVLFNRTRPLIGWQPRVTLTGSIFAESREDLLFANRPELQASYATAIALVEGTGCRQIGLRIDSHDPEYAFWALSGGSAGRRIEVVNPEPLTARYGKPNFAPCAVVCTICDRAAVELGDLELAWADDRVQLYLDLSLLPALRAEGAHRPNGQACTAGFGIGRIRFSAPRISRTAC